MDPIVIDGMGSAALLPSAQVPPPAIDGKPWLDRALASGLTAMNVTIGVTGVAMGADDFRTVLHTMHGYFCYFDLEPRLLHVLTTDDIRRAKREGRLGIIFGCQGIATKLDGDPSMILDHGAARSAYHPASCTMRRAPSAAVHWKPRTRASPSSVVSASARSTIAAWWWTLRTRARGRPASNRLRAGHSDHQPWQCPRAHQAPAQCTRRCT